MPSKTIHLLMLTAPPGQAPQVAQAVRATAGAVTFVQVQGEPQARRVEVRLPHADLPTALELARTLSSGQRYPVAAQLYVNAAWSPQVVDVPDHAHLIEVQGTVQAVRRTWPEAPHVQVRGAGRVQVVLPPETPENQVTDTATWLEEQVGPVQVHLWAAGSWQPNGSRHHRVVRYRRGTPLPSGSDVVWRD